MSDRFKRPKVEPHRLEGVWGLVEDDQPSWEIEWAPEQLTIPSLSGIAECQPYERLAKTHFGLQHEAAALAAQAFVQYSAHISEMIERRWQLTLLEKLVSDLRTRVHDLERDKGLLVSIETFAPEPFEVVKPFCVVVEQVDDEDFIATLYDANVSASGDTREEAVFNFKDTVLATFEMLESEKKLGAAMRRQKAVLSALIRRR